MNESGRIALSKAKQGLPRSFLFFAVGRTLFLDVSGVHFFFGFDIIHNFLGYTSRALLFLNVDCVYFSFWM